MRRRGMSHEEMTAALQVTNQRRCQPSLPEDQVERIARSVARYAPTNGHSNGHSNGHGNGHSNGQGLVRDRINGYVPAANVGFRRTDMGNGERLVAQHGPNIRYCYLWKKWLIWDGRRWLEDHQGQIETLAKQSVRAIYREAEIEPDEDRRKELAKHATRSESKSRVEAMLDMGRSEAGIPILPDAFDTDLWALNVHNGTLDLRTGQLRPHRPADWITRLAPVPYQPEATCPRWDAFLDRILDGNADLIAFVRRAVGYALTGSTRDQVLFMLYGTGANGKSTFLETLQSLLGDYARPTDFTTFLPKNQDGPRNDIARLLGARLVTAAEAEAGRRLSEVIVKQLTGGDTIIARRLHEEFFEFRPQFKLFLAANHRPVVRGTDHALWRRIRMIPFTVTIPEQEREKDLPARLLEELPGILAWAVRGCLEWQQDGLGNPEAVQQATRAYQEDMDPIADFLADGCVLNETAQAKAGDLYNAYEAWAMDQGEKPISQRMFGQQLGEKKFAKKKTKRGYFYSGVGVLNPALEG